APHGRIALGILLFQDLMLAPILATTPLLAGVDAGTPLEVAIRFGASAAVLAGVFVAARFLVPPFLGRLIGVRLHDIFLLAAVATCLGLALLTAELGFSAALGAFLAGVLLAESDYSHQVAAEMAPFRDVFTNFFFVSVGMLVDLGQAGAHLPAVLGLTAGVILLKSLVAGAASLAAGLGPRAAVTTGMGLAQIGEFSFVLAIVGRNHGLLDGELYQVILATSMLTLLLTPALVHLAPRIADRLSQKEPAPPEIPVDRDHVVLVGYDLNAQGLGRILSEGRIPWAAVELDRTRVRAAHRRGEPVTLGDGSRRGILEHTGIHTARVAVFAIPDPWALRRGISVARELNPDLYILARARRVEDIDELAELGADEVIAEELETSIEVVTRVLRRFHVPRNVIDSEVRLLRAERYEMLRRRAPSEAATRTLLAALEEGTTEIYRIGKGDAAAGRSLSGLDLRRTTGASVIAVVRDGVPRGHPSPSLRLEPGDDLVLAGGHAEIEAAFRLLGGP
ncbi:MAG: cation:proton antiporter, partial [Thermoanaerobaculia bacterium]|nr:cation:proton antiporter [Thermoanaerobaculia bacterium]